MYGGRIDRKLEIAASRTLSAMLQGRGIPAPGDARSAVRASDEGTPQGF